MGIGGAGRGGETGATQSNLFLKLPFRNYRDWDTTNQRAWIEEFIDAIGLELDILKVRFCDATARSNLLDPTYTPTEVADATTATATAPPTSSTVTDTMLDILCYIAGMPTPVDTNMSIAQKQSLVAAGWDLLKRKGTRKQLLTIASILGNGVAVGWTVLPWQFAVILPDGCPSPGYGSWVPSAAPAIERPWPIPAIRRHFTERVFPAWAESGAGYSQFRAGFSGAGEPVLSTGARINILSGEHFSAWTAGVPDGWTKIGTPTLTENTTDASRNIEFTSSCLQLDLTGAAVGVQTGVKQTALAVNNQAQHRLEVDYSYRPTPAVVKLVCRITDETNTHYYNNVTGAWQSTAYDMLITPGATSTTRTRFSVDFNLQANSTTGTTRGTETLAVQVTATSDGTSTSQIAYRVYRAGLYQKFSTAIEDAAGGERTGWFPIVDGRCETTFTRAGASTVVEMANEDRNAYKVLSSLATFPYHPALTGRGYQSNRRWINLLLGSNDFGADWTLSNATAAANQDISPIIGETSATAPRLTKTTAAGYTEQTGLVADPSSKAYIAGVFVKALTGGGAYSDVTLTLYANGGVTSQSQTYTVTANAWTLLPMRAVSFVGGDAGFPLAFRIAWASGLNGRTIALATAYVYDVTSKTAVLYPPLCQTPIGASGSVFDAELVANVSGAALHPLHLRQMVNLSGGLVNLTVVPTFDAGSQPDGTIFDFGQTLARNRLQLSVASGALRLRLIDDASANHDASITMSTAEDPAAGTMTWKRDTSISVHARWSATTGLDLSAGNGNAIQYASVPWTVSSSSLVTIGIGNNFTGAAGQFDGLIRNVEIIQTGQVT